MQMVFLFLISLAVMGLSCSTWDLQSWCGMWNLIVEAPRI